MVSSTSTSTTGTSTGTQGTTKKTQVSKQQRPISIRKRMLLCFFWTVFGLVFFYLVMVLLSTVSEGITLERLEPNGWARSASRHTAAVTAPVFALFLLSSPSSLWSLFLAVMAACAQFCHFVIISSDLSVYVDREIAERVFHIDDMHPLFRRLPLYTAHVVGTLGFVAFLVITSERCFGPALRHRRSTLPAASLGAAGIITAVFTLWFVDHLINAIASAAPLEHIAYPVAFLAPLLVGQVVTWRRVQAASAAKSAIGKSKKSN